VALLTRWSCRAYLSFCGASCSTTSPPSSAPGRILRGFETPTEFCKTYCKPPTNTLSRDYLRNATLETGDVLVSEKIKLEFDVSAIKNA